MKKYSALAVLLVIFSLPLGAQALVPPGPVDQALMESAFNGDPEGVKRLLADGANVNATGMELRTALMGASFNGHTGVVKLLLENGAVLDARDSSGRTALLYASSGPYPEAVEYLLNQGAEIDLQGTEEGFTALMMAAAEGQMEVVQLLLAKGAKADTRDKDGDTAETFARQSGHSAVAELLAMGDQ